MARYEAQLDHAWQNHVVGSFPPMQTISYRLVCNESTINASFESTESGRFTVGLSSVSGSPQFSEQHGSVINEAIAFLERYSNYSHKEYPKKFAYTLSAVEEIETMKILAPNITLKVNQVRTNASYFAWTNTVGGIDNSYNRFLLDFDGDLMSSMWDEWTRYPLPTPQVNISQQDAIQMAKECYKDQPTNPYGGLLGVSVAGLTFQPRDGVLYPQWKVILPFPKSPPAPLTCSPDSENYWWYKSYYDMAVEFYNSDSYNGAKYLIWADTGNITDAGTEVAKITYAPNLGPPDNTSTVSITIPSVSLRIVVLSPGNLTYNTPSVPLIFSYNEQPYWACYNLDQEANTAIEANITLTNLSDGTHSLVIYANDTEGGIARSDTIEFVISTAASPSSNQDSSLEPTPTLGVTPSPTVPEMPPWMLLPLIFTASATYLLMKNQRFRKRS